MSRSDESDISYGEILEFLEDRLTDNNEFRESGPELEYSPEEFALILNENTETSEENVLRERLSNNFMSNENTSNANIINNSISNNSNEEYNNVNISSTNDTLNEISRTTRGDSKMEPVTTNTIASSEIRQNYIFPVREEESSATLASTTTTATSTLPVVVEAVTSVDRGSGTLTSAYTLPSFVIYSNESNSYVNAATTLPNLVNFYTLANTSLQPILLSAPLTTATSSSSSSSLLAASPAQTQQFSELQQLIVMENRSVDMVQANYPQVISLQEQRNYLQSCLPKSTGQYYLQRAEEASMPPIQHVQRLPQQELQEERQRREQQQLQRLQSQEQKQHWEQQSQQPRALTMVQPCEYVTTNYGLSVTQEKRIMQPSSVYQGATSISGRTFAPQQPISSSIRPVYGVEHIELLRPPSYYSPNKEFSEKDVSIKINKERSVNETTTSSELEKESAASSRATSQTRKLLFIRGVRGVKDIMEISKKLSKAYLFANPEDAYEFERIHNEKPDFNDLYVPPLAWPAPLKGEMPSAYYKHLRRQKKIQERQ